MFCDEAVTGTPNGSDLYQFVGKQTCGVANFQSLTYFIKILIIKLAHSLCLIWTLWAFGQMLQRLAPRKFGVVLEWGTRTFHVYLLHHIIVVMAAVRMGVPKILPFHARDSWDLPGADEIAFIIFISAVSTFVCASRLSNLLFGWIVFPMWLLDVSDHVSSMFGWIKEKDPQATASRYASTNQNQHPFHEMLAKEAAEAEKASKASS